jgi:S1-C subfamily serine protease
MQEESIMLCSLQRKILAAVVCGAIGWQGVGLAYGQAGAGGGASGGAGAGGSASGGAGAGGAGAAGGAGGAVGGNAAGGVGNAAGGQPGNAPGNVPDSTPGGVPGRQPGRGNAGADDQGNTNQGNTRQGNAGRQGRNAADQPSDDSPRSPNRRAGNNDNTDNRSSDAERAQQRRDERTQRRDRRGDENVGGQGRTTRQRDTETDGTTRRSTDDDGTTRRSTDGADANTDRRSRVNRLRDRLRDPGTLTDRADDDTTDRDDTRTTDRDSRTTDSDARTTDDADGTRRDENRLDADGNLDGRSEFQDDDARFDADGNLDGSTRTNDGSALDADADGRLNTTNDGDATNRTERFRRQIGGLRDRLDRLHDRLNDHLRDGDEEFGDDRRFDRDGRFDRDRFGDGRRFDRDGRFDGDDDFRRGDGSGRWSDFLDTLGLEFSAEADGQLTIGDLADSSLAAQLQLRPGDTIQAVNGRAVESPRELAQALSNLRAGSWLEFDVLRDGQTQSIRAEWNDDLAMAVRPGNSNPNQAWSVDADRLESLGFTFSGDASGQLTLGDIANTSVAAKLRLQAGDTITAINGQPVGSSEDFVDAFDGLHPGSRLALEVERDGERRLISTTLRPAFFRDSPTTSSAARRSDFGIAGFGAEFSTDANGMLTINNLASSGYAGQVGLQQGDVLLSVNGREVTSANDLQSQIDDPRAAGTIRVLRDGRVLTLRTAARVVPPGTDRDDQLDPSRSSEPSALPGAPRLDEDASQ